MGLVALLAYIGHHEATDDRDRIYAVLGICRDVDRSIVGVPDYSLSVEDVYTRLVVGFMQQHKSLNILCMRTLFTRGSECSASNSSPQQPDRLPTWVPDFRRWTYGASRPVPSMVSEPSRDEIGNFREIRDPQHGVVDPGLRYSASAGLAAEFLVSADRRRLTCKGVVVGVLDGLGPVRQCDQEGIFGEYVASTLVQSTSSLNKKVVVVVGGSCPDPGEPSAQSNLVDTSYAVVESLVRCLCLDRAGRYLMWPANVNNFVYQLWKCLEPARFGSHHVPEPGLTRFLAANSELCVLNGSISEHVGRMRRPCPESHRFSRYSFGDAAEVTVGGRPWDCRLVTTDQGHLGMAPRQAIKGDVVAVLIGCSVPVVLRESKDASGYEVVGEAFIPGLMEGQAIDGSKKPVELTLI
jgi:hypothetical protein